MERLVGIVQRLRHIGGVGGTCRVKLRVREGRPVRLRLRVRGGGVEKVEKGGDEAHGKVGVKERAVQGIERRMSYTSGKGEGERSVEGCTSGESAWEAKMGSVELEIPEEPDVDDGEEAVVSELVAESMLRLDIPEEPEVDSTQEVDDDKSLLDGLRARKGDRDGGAKVDGVHECETGVQIGKKVQLVENGDVAEETRHVMDGSMGTIEVGPWMNGDVESGGRLEDVASLRYTNESCLRVDASDIVSLRHHEVGNVQQLRESSGAHSSRDPYRPPVASANDVRNVEIFKKAYINSATHVCEKVEASCVDSSRNNGANRGIPLRLRICDPNRVPPRTSVCALTSKGRRNNLQALKSNNNAPQNDEKYETETVCGGVKESFCERIRKRMRVVQNVRETNGSSTTKDGEHLTTVNMDQKLTNQDGRFSTAYNLHDSTKAGMEHSDEAPSSVLLCLRLRKYTKLHRSAESPPSIKLPFDDSESESPDTNANVSDGEAADDGPCNSASLMDRLPSSCDITPRNLGRIFSGTDPTDSPCMGHEDNHSYSPTILDSGSAPGSAGKNSADYHAGAEAGPPRETTLNGEYEARAETRGIGDGSKLICRRRQYAVCISGMDKDSAELALAEELLPLRGTEFSEGFDSEPTPSCVLTVFDENMNVLRPRMVILEAMARRIPIVNLDWLITSCRVGFLVDTEPFEAMSNHRREGPGIFERIVATLDNSFDQPAAKHMVRKAGQDIHRLLRAGGANVVDREQLATFLCEGDIVVLHIHVVNDFGADGSTSPETSAKHMEQPRVAHQKIPTKVVNMAWISDSICSGQCPPPRVEQSDSGSMP